MSDTSYGDISPRTAAFATLQLEKRGIPFMCFEMIGQSRPIPRNETNAVKFRRYESLAPAVVPIVEGVTPLAVKMQNTDITATLVQYGNTITVSDVITDTHEDKVLQEAMGMLGENAAETLEIIRFNGLVGGTNVVYNGAVTSRATVASKIDRPSLRRVTAALERMRGRKITSILSTKPNFNTVSIEPAFWAVVHTDADAGVRDLTAFKNASDYPTPSSYENEIGQCEMIRFLKSQLTTPFADAGGAVAGTGLKSTSGTSCDVYPGLVFARDAFGIVPLKGEGAIVPMVVNAKPSDSDPMAQRNKASWKAYHTVARLNENWMVRWEFCIAA